MLLGRLDSVSEKAKREGVPSNGNKSIYNKERYKFALFAPFDITNKCCYVLKKSPMKKYNKENGLKPILATCASESRLRTTMWLHNGCNGFDMKSPISNPMSFWTEQDVLLYIKIHNLEIAPVYGEVKTDYKADGQLDGQMSLSDLDADKFGLFEIDRPTLYTTGMDRTGCFACMFGCHLEKKEENNRFFNTMKCSNPKLVDWMLRGGEFRESDGKWHPKNGLGYWFIMEWCNKYGNMKYIYPDREHYIETYSTPETDFWLKGDGINGEGGVFRILAEALEDK